MSVVVGAQRFAHCEWLRADRVLRAMLGVESFPSDDTIRNFFLRFSQGHIEAFWRPLWRWLLLLLKCPNGGFALDLDSTVFCREGKPEWVDPFHRHPLDLFDARDLILDGKLGVITPVAFP